MEWNAFPVTRIAQITQLELEAPCVVLNWEVATELILTLRALHNRRPLARAEGT